MANIIFIGGSYNHQLRNIYSSALYRDYIDLPYQDDTTVNLFASEYVKKEQPELERYYIHTISFTDGYNNIYFNFAVKRSELVNSICHELQQTKIKTYDELAKWVKKHY